MTVKTKTKKVGSGEHESIINNSPALLAGFDVGCVSHQGDLIIVGIAALPKSAKPRLDRQLAVGDTQGSRHVLERGEVYQADAEEVARLILAATGCAIDTRYIGPVFVSPAEPTPHDLTHPEHGHQGFPAGTICAVVYQRNLDQEEREQVVQD
jgi:hypothetical protein